MFASRSTIDRRMISNIFLQALFCPCCGATACIRRELRYALRWHRHQRASGPEDVGGGRLAWASGGTGCGGYMLHCICCRPCSLTQEVRAAGRAIRLPSVAVVGWWLFGQLRELRATFPETNGKIPRPQGPIPQRIFPVQYDSD